LWAFSFLQLSHIEQYLYIIYPLLIDYLFDVILWRRQVRFFGYVFDAVLKHFVSFLESRLRAVGVFRRMGQNTANNIEFIETNERIEGRLAEFVLCGASYLLVGRQWWSEMCRAIEESGRQICSRCN
jgi:hypothetical protein